jgi:hypothetical protein
MNHRKILVIGYYHRKNLGDDVFEYVLTNYFKTNWPYAEYNIVSIDDLVEIPLDTSLVIFGGGDLINDYFMRKINRFITNKTCPWYAISIGIPYPSLIEKGYLDRFDYIIHRNQEDKLELLNKYNIRSEWYPDMSFMMQLNNITNNNNFNLFQGKRKIGIFLSQNMYSAKDTSGYYRIVNSIAHFLSRVANITETQTQGFNRVRVPIYELYLIPFCTDQKETHDDNIINRNIYNIIQGYDNVHLITKPLSISNLNTLFDSFYMTICTRYHAHMFSLMSKVPILSIYSTRKVDNLLSELDAKIYSVKIIKDPSGDYPIDVDGSDLWDKFNYIEETRDEYMDKLNTLHRLYSLKTKEFKNKLDNLIFHLPRYVLPDELDIIATEKSSQIIDKIIDLYNKQGNTKLIPDTIKPKNSTRTKKSSRNNKSEKYSRTKKSEKSSRTNKSEKSSRNKSGKSSRTKKSEKNTRNNKSEKTSTIKSKAPEIFSNNEDVKVMMEALENRLIYTSTNLIPVIDQTNITTNISTDQLLHYHDSYYVEIDIKKDDLYQNGAIGKYFSSLNSNNKNLLVEMISYELTGSKISEYNYGLLEQIYNLDYNLLESCKWIIRHKHDKDRLDLTSYDFIENYKYPIENRKINVMSINKDLFHGYHRSGWSYVLDHIKDLHNPNGVIFDSYLDKTFGWEYDFLTTSQIIPYQQRWIGVFHHTPNEDYTENNLSRIFRRSNFIRSLLFCEGIIVLSETNRKWVKFQLDKLKLDRDIKVLSLYHPTEKIDDNIKFNYNVFIGQPLKRIFQIGGWLRNSYAIYDISVPEDYQKLALQGKGMENYYISDDKFCCIVDSLKIEDLTVTHRGSYNGNGGGNGNGNNGNGNGNNGNGNGNGGSNNGNKLNMNMNMNTNTNTNIINNYCNKYIVGMTDRLVSNHNSVTILENITNEEYDDILTNSVVFINLVDASAVNTILECMSRNTPILVNRLPATEQYLGVSYPLFYNSPMDVYTLLSDVKNIKRAHVYLSKLDKTKITIECFMESFMKSEIYRKL